MKPGIRYRVTRVIQSPATQRIKARLQGLSRAGQRPWVLPVGIASLVVAVFLISAASPVSNAGESDEVRIQQAVGELSIAATRSTASEAGPAAALIRIALTSPSNQDLTVNVDVSGTAQNGVDYRRVETQVTIPAGRLFGTITIVPIDDHDIEGDEAMSVALAEGHGYKVGTPDTAMATIEDNDRPVVSLAASTEPATENRATAASFTVSRTGPLTTDLSVFFVIRGSATPEADYAPVPTTVVVPAGESSALVEITPIDDDEIEDGETVTLILVGDSAYALESTLQATVTIEDNDQPVVNVTAASTVVPESGPPGLFTISRIGPTTAPLVVSYAVGGSATADVDYENLPGSVTISAGQVSATVRLVPIDDDLASESAETVTVDVRPSPDYQVGDRFAATLTLEDDDLALVIVEATDLNASEAGPDQAVFTVRRTGQATSELAVTYTLGGTAINGVDYQTLGGSVVIPQGAAAVTVVIVPIDDPLFEPEETVSFVLVPGPGYETGGAEGTAIIGPSDVATVDVAREENTGEGDSDPGAFIVSRTGDLSSDLIISYTVTGSATSGVDYVALTGFVVIPAGESTAIVIVIPIDDEEEEDREEAIITLSPGLDYEIGEDASVKIRIGDNDDEKDGE